MKPAEKLVLADGLYPGITSHPNGVVPSERTLMQLAADIAKVLPLATDGQSLFMMDGMIPGGHRDSKFKYLMVINDDNKKRVLVTVFERNE